MKTYTPGRLEFDTNLVGRMVELRYPNGEGGFYPRRPRGRVGAAYPTPTGYGTVGMCLWLEVEDEQSAASFSDNYFCAEQAQIGDVVMVTTASDCGSPAVVRIIKDEPSDDPLLNASAALRVALEDVVRARRLVDEALHQREKSDAA